MNILVLDTEATTYETGNPFSKPNRLMCVGTLFNGEYEYHDIEYSGLPYHESIERLTQLLNQASLIVGFNFKYDLHWLRKYLRRSAFPAIFDCQLAEFILRNQTNPYPSLDFSSRMHGGNPKHDLIAEEYWNKGIDTDKVPLDILKDRVISDVQITYELYLSQLKQLTEQGKLALFKAQCADTLVLADMEYNGMVYDTKKSLQLGEEIDIHKNEVIKELNQLVGTSSFNPDSPHHLSAILYGGWIKSEGTETYTRTLKSGEVKTKTRKCTLYTSFPALVKPLDGSETKATTGMDEYSLKLYNRARKADKKDKIQRVWSTDEPTLRSLKATGKSKQIIALLLQQSKLEKLGGTYYNGIPQTITKMAWPEGIIHGGFNQCVARTGRLSSSKPNLQNFSSEIKPLFPCRNDILINVDAKGLEWVCAAYLSQDSAAIKELLDGVDHHEVNRVRFGLPTRLVSKTFLFRLIYGGSAYSYAHDPDFTETSTSEKFWQNVIDESYVKYSGLGKWHTSIIQEVIATGRLVMPTGRVYTFERQKHGNGSKWPETQIKNYPVQGLGADLLTLIRVSLSKRMKKLGLRSLLICTVHDSILVDAFMDEMETICKLMTYVFADMNSNFKKVFGVDFNLPLKGEISVGPTWADMTEWKGK